MGCGALKHLSPEHGEIKSMRTDSAHRHKGVASRLLSYILEEARRRGYKRISLETGSMDLSLQPAACTPSSGSRNVVRSPIMLRTQIAFM